MTIDERVEQLRTASHCFDAQFRADAKRILLEVARDQRHACAEALLECETTHHDAQEWKAAHQAVMK